MPSIGCFGLFKLKRQLTKKLGFTTEQPEKYSHLVYQNLSFRANHRIVHNVKGVAVSMDIWKTSAQPFLCF
jgi:hypothetical protein